MDGNYEISYLCTYEMREDLLEIKAEYEIDEEIEAVNGFKIRTSNMEFRKRDLLLVDFQNKKKYLLKNAWYAGDSAVYLPPFNLMFILNTEMQRDSWTFRQRQRQIT